MGGWFGKTESHSLSLPHPVHKSYGTFSSGITITTMLSQHIGLLGGGPTNSKYLGPVGGLYDISKLLQDDFIFEH